MPQSRYRFRQVTPTAYLQDALLGLPMGVARIADYEPLAPVTISRHGELRSPISALGSHLEIFVRHIV